jgi:hypothetical protein
MWHARRRPDGTFCDPVVGGDRSQCDDATAEARRLQTINQVSAALFAATYLYGVLDAYMSHGAMLSGPESPTARHAARALGRGVQDRPRLQIWPGGLALSGTF